MRCRERQRGIALVTVLWLLLLLSLLAMGALRDARTESNLTRNSLEAAEARSLADAGIQRAILELLKDDDERVWRHDGSSNPWIFGDGQLRIAISDEGGKIDLNRASPLLLKGLLRAAGVERRTADALADAVIDYRDDDSLRRLNGAEDQDYRDAELPYEAKDAPFERVEELRQVVGMTESLFARIEPAVTVHSRNAKINIAAAPKLALLALPGVAPSDVDAYLAGRQTSQGDLDRSLLGVDPESKTALLLSSVGRGRFFQLRVEARTPAGALFIRRAIVRVVRSARPPYRFEAWEQG